MSTITCEPEVAQQEPLVSTEEQHLFLSNVDWQSYIAVGNAFSDRPGLRITYDRGNLEFMTTSRLHELYKVWLNRLIEVMAEELARPIAPGGNMTFQRQDLERGIEGDHCFWIKDEQRMRIKPAWDPKVDPPPDLFLEIEVSRTVINRLSICAALRIAEVWSFNGERIRIYRLQPDGNYRISDSSQFFPEIPVSEIVRFVKLDGSSDYLTAAQEFRAWLRQVLGKPPLP